MSMNFDERKNKKSSKKASVRSTNNGRRKDGRRFKYKPSNRTD